MIESLLLHLGGDAENPQNAKCIQHHCAQRKNAFILPGKYRTDVGLDVLHLHDKAVPKSQE